MPACSSDPLPLSPGSDYASERFPPHDLPPDVRRGHVRGPIRRRPAGPDAGRGAGGAVPVPRPRNGGERRDEALLRGKRASSFMM